jgi:hypothetical protein
METEKRGKKEDKNHHDGHSMRACFVTNLAEVEKGDHVKGLTRISSRRSVMNS